MKSSFYCLEFKGRSRSSATTMVIAIHGGCHISWIGLRLELGFAELPRNKAFASVLMYEDVIPSSDVGYNLRFRLIKYWHLFKVEFEGGINGSGSDRP